VVIVVTKGYTIHLKNWDWGKVHKPKKGIDIAYKLIDIQNKECYATLFGSAKDGIYRNEINSELEKLSKNILTERTRTIKNKPKFKVINGVKEVIN